MEFPIEIRTGHTLTEFYGSFDSVSACNIMY